MLILSRKVGESIRIGGIVEVFVVAIVGDKVRIGVTAPSEIPVHRKKIAEAIRKENADQDEKRRMTLRKEPKP